MIALRDGRGIACLGIAGAMFWLACAMIARVDEPWDAAVHWSAAYPGLILVAGLSGLTMGRRGWWAAAVLILSQFAVMLAGTGTGAMWLPGLMWAGALADPAELISALTGRMGLRAGRG